MGSRSNHIAFVEMYGMLLGELFVVALVILRKEIARNGGIMHPVTKSRTPFGLFFDIMDYKCIAIDGKPCPEAGESIYMRVDSHGRIFVKTADTNNLWEKVAQLPTKKLPMKGVE